MSILTSKTSLAIVSAVLCLGGHGAHAQSSPVRYWTPGSLFGFGGSFADGQKVDSYGNFPSFGEGGAPGGGQAHLGSNLPTGWFVGGEGGRAGFNGLGQSGAFGSFEYQGTQVGYNFKGADGSPVTFFAGFDSLKYNAPGIGGPIAPFSTSSGTPVGYAARAGLEFRPTSNVSLSFGVGYTQLQSERTDSDINSPLLPGQSPILFGGR